jgi:DNA-binding transcriptional regulator YdaS (Cro superfamily)
MTKKPTNPSALKRGDSLISAQEAAGILGVVDSRVRQMVTAGTLVPAGRFGRSLQLSQKAVEALAKGRAKESAAKARAKAKATKARSL